MEELMGSNPLGNQKWDISSSLTCPLCPFITQKMLRIGSQVSEETPACKYSCFCLHSSHTLICDAPEPGDPVSSCPCSFRDQPTHCHMNVGRINAWLQDLMNEHIGVMRRKSWGWFQTFHLKFTSSRKSVSCRLVFPCSSLICLPGNLNSIYSRKLFPRKCWNFILATVQEKALHVSWYISPYLIDSLIQIFPLLYLCSPFDLLVDTVWHCLVGPVFTPERVSVEIRVYLTIISKKLKVYLYMLIYYRHIKDFFTC